MSFAYYTCKKCGDRMLVQNTDKLKPIEERIAIVQQAMAKYQRTAGSYHAIAEKYDALILEQLEAQMYED